MDKQKEKLKAMLQVEREKVAGYEQLAKVHSAYIAILLMKLGANEENMVTITAEEVKEALKSAETRAVQVDGGYGLYYEAVE